MDERMTGERHEGRIVLEIGGADRRDFLQGLVSNDIGRLDDGLVYAALLTPQGKYLADFFLCNGGDVILLDVSETLAGDLVKRLRMYKLRADVTIAESKLAPFRGLGEMPADAKADPRHADLGWRRYGTEDGAPAQVDWDALRVALGVPETGIELAPGETYPLEAGFERLNGVDFRKGCYVGQEVTARMKHKTSLRKGIVRVSVEGAPPPPGTEILAGDKPAGALYTTSNGQGLAFLRFDRAQGPMQAGEATVTWSGDL